MITGRVMRDYRALREQGFTARDAYSQAKYAADVRAFMDTLPDYDFRNDGSQVWTWQDGDWHITVTINRDDWAGRPEDNGDCYDAEDIAAWENDDWHYYVAHVSARLGLFAADNSLGGIDAGDHWEASNRLDTEGQVWSVIREHDMIETAKAEALQLAERSVSGATR